MPFSISLLCAVTIQLLCQMFKVVFYSLKEHRLRLNYFVSTGGMPSGHTAFVSALTVSVGLNRGFSSEFFTIVFVFSSIIVYDIVRVWGAVQTHSRILTVLLEKLPREDRIQLPQLVGHTIGEVLIGLQWVPDSPLPCISCFRLRRVVLRRSGYLPRTPTLRQYRKLY